MCWVTTSLLEHVWATSSRVLLGFLAGGLVGTVAGTITGRCALARLLLDPSLQALRSIPSLAWVPLFLLWLGIDELPKITLIGVGVFFPVYLNLMTALLAIEEKWVEVARLYRYGRVQLIRRVLLPACLPAYVTGLRSGLGLGWMFVVASELLGASRGLGYLMLDGQTTNRPELIVASLGMFALLGKVSDAAVHKVGARFCAR